MAHRGFETPFLTFFGPLREEAAACGTPLQARERIIVEDVRQSAVFAGQPSLDVLLNSDVQAVQSTRLMSSDGCVLGMISTHFGKPHRPSERDLRFLDLLVRISADYLERRRAQESEKLLMRELQHRGCNLLAVVQSIAQRTLSGKHYDEAREAFEARLQALARCYKYFGPGEGCGIGLRELVRLELEPFSERTKVDGADIKLGSQQAQNISLALHELTTNAMKYGALSAQAGRIEVSWKVPDGSEPVLRFKWKERDGPPVTKPTREGFGTTLLRATFPEVCFDYDQDGFRCEMAAPLMTMEPAAI